jgi:hypothetical protein
MAPTMSRKYGFNNTRLYLTAQDPIVFTHYQGYDPENGTTGGAPAFRTIIFGANFGW